MADGQTFIGLSQHEVPLALLAVIEAAGAGDAPLLLAQALEALSDEGPQDLPGSV